MDADTAKHLRAWCMRFGWETDGQDRYLLMFEFLDSLDAEDRKVWLDRGWSALWDHLMTSNRN